MNRKSSVAVIALAVLMSIVAVIFLFFDKSTQAPKSEVSTQVEDSGTSVSSPNSLITPTSSADVLLESPEDSLPAEDEPSVIEGGEADDLQLDTNF